MQILTSGEMGWNSPSWASERKIENSGNPFGVIFSEVIVSIRANGGAWSDRAFMKDSSPSPDPSNSISTPAEVFRTHPVSDSS
jgi:hypothetical protein